MGSGHYLTPQSRWHATATRDPAAFAAFVYAVRTTRIYCRPTCPARLARRANVVFFDAAADAQTHGFRACKRCRPDDWSTRGARDEQDMLILRACNFIDGESRAPRVTDVAKHLGLSDRYVAGLFRRCTGMSVRAYWELRFRGGVANTGSEASETIMLPDTSTDDGTSLEAWLASPEEETI